MYIVICDNTPEVICKLMEEEEEEELFFKEDILVCGRILQVYLKSHTFIQQ